MTPSDVLLTLLRAALGKGGLKALPADVDWQEVLRLADAQGVAAIAADGLQIADAKIPQLARLEWAGRVVMHEQAYLQHEKAIEGLALFYKGHGFRMMVLKGWGLAQEYPVPNHRPSGDLDIWNFGEWRKADETVAESGIEIDNAHHHHTVFTYHGITVENHYDFINTHAHRSSKRFEKRLKELAQNGNKEWHVGETSIWLPSQDFNMLFLLRHSANHFAGKEMTLRQLLDWALYVEHHHEDMDWQANLSFLSREGLGRYFNILATICVEELGFAPNIFHCELQNDELKERVLADILQPEFNETIRGNAVAVMYGKMRRWWSNRWKHKLCYPDSLASAFIYGLWAKIQKPRHFLD